MLSMNVSRDHAFDASSLNLSYDILTNILSLCRFPITLLVLKVLKTVKGLEKQGYTFEGADASVNLLVRRTMSGYVAPFK